MPRSRPVTEMYLATVEAAMADPGRWVEVPRFFATEANASVTASCLAGGYLRVEPREGDVPVLVDGKRYIATAGPVDTRATKAGEHWRLMIRAMRD